MGWFRPGIHILFAVIWLVPLFAERKKLSLSVADIENLAIERSLSLKAARAGVQLAETEVKTAAVWDNPELSFQYDYHALTPSAANNPATVDVRLSQPLQLFGLRGARVDQARAGVKQAELQSADFKRNFILQVRLAAYKLMVLEKAVEFQRAFYDNYRKLLKANQFRYEKGDISEYELKKLEVEGTRYENSIVALEIEIKKKQNDLKKSLSLDERDFIEITDELRQPEPGEIRELLQRDANIESRADLLAIRNEIQLAEKSLVVAEKENAPDFALAGQYHYEPGSALFQTNHYFGLGVTMPLKILNRNQGKREGYARLIEKKKYTYEQELLAAKAELAAQKNAINQYLVVLINGRYRLSLAKEIYEKGRLLYTKKAANLIQLLESERSYFEMQREYFEVLYNFQESLELYFSMTKSYS